MNTHIVLTLGDLFGLAIFGLIVVGLLGWFAYCFFMDWKNSPKRWWNKGKR